MPVTNKRFGAENAGISYGEALTSRTVTLLTRHEPALSTGLTDRYRHVTVARIASQRTQQTQLDMSFDLTNE